MRVIMGVDPSTKTGVVIIKGDEVLYQGTIRSNTDNYLTNGFIIAEKLLELIIHYKVGYVCIENYALNARFRLVDMVTLGTVIRLHLLKNRWFDGGFAELFKIYQLEPLVLKKWATKKGGAKKVDMKRHAKAKGFTGNNDEVDAFFLAKYLQAGVELSLLDLKETNWLTM